MIRFYANTMKQIILHTKKWKVSLGIYVAQINHKNFFNFKKKS